MKLTVGSLFTGIGGADLGFQRSGFKTIWMCERDKHCQKLLRDKFRGVAIYNDVNDLLIPKLKIPFVNVLIGGDPCPHHSNAKADKKSTHPDMSGHFLAVVGRLGPQWVVRENVPAPTVSDFAITLEALGYSVVVISANADEFTAQNRERKFVVGCVREKLLAKAFHDCARNSGTRLPLLEERRAVVCLTANNGEGSCRDAYVWELENGLRNFNSEECEFFGGFPIGWTEGFSTPVRKRMVGNAIIPAVAEEIAVRIKRASKGISGWPKPDPEEGIRKLLSRHLTL